MPVALRKPALLAVLSLLCPLHTVLALPHGTSTPRLPRPSSPRLPQEARELQAQSRELRDALAQSQREASLLASDLERTTAQLAEARKEATEAQAAAATARSRVKLLVRRLRRNTTAAPVDVGGYSCRCA